MITGGNHKVVAAATIAIMAAAKIVQQVIMQTIKLLSFTGPNIWLVQI